MTPLERLNINFRWMKISNAVAGFAKAHVLACGCGPTSWYHWSYGVVGGVKSCFVYNSSDTSDKRFATALSLKSHLPDIV